MGDTRLPTAIQTSKRALKLLYEELQEETHIWTDSKCALAWVTGNQQRPQFIARRIKTIHEVNNVMYGHVSGKENPADIVSRGANATSLQQNTLWWEGPTWLKAGSYPESMIPAMQATGSEMPICEENADEGPSLESAFVSNEHNEVVNCEKFSSFSKLVRVNAWVQRFIRKLKHEKSESETNLTAEEIAMSRVAIIRYHQAQHFGNEIKAIEQGKRHQLVDALDLFLDNGLIRCKGRLEYSHLPFESKFPLLLAYGSHLTRLIVMEQHISLKHSGVSQTLAELRRNYWVPKGRAMVRRVIKECLLCKRHHGKPFATPQFAPLPEERLVPGRVFESVGLDYFGPMYVKMETETAKVWVCILTCLTTRAIHMELVRNMSTEQFLMCFRRFISRRGTPKYIVSDNAKQFKLSKNVIDLLWLESIQHNDVMEFIAGKGIKWKYITELAPWMGGVYERMIGIVKRSLKKSIGTGQLTCCQLETLLIEIEAIVNSRPLVYVGEDFTIDHVLTPANFLTGHSSLGQPNFVITDDPDYITHVSNAQQLVNLWKQQQKCLNIFWQKWSAEYLQSLRPQQHSQRNSNNFKPSVNCIVLIKDVDRPRSCWKIGRIAQLHQSTDGEVRSVTLSMPSGSSMNRPVSHLYPLECSSGEVTTAEVPEPTIAPLPERPRRNAATAATMRTRDLIEDGQV